MLSRFGALLAAACLTALGLLALPGVAAAEHSCVALVCPSHSPTPTPSPTPSPTATPTRSERPQPTRTRSPRSTPRPQSTQTTRAPRPTATARPTLTSTSATTAPLFEPTPVAVTPRQAPSKPTDRATQLIGLVLTAAVLLGIGGATGLYLTRHVEEE